MAVGPPTAQDSEGEDLAVVRSRLSSFARGYAHLPLYGTITAAACEDDEVAGLLTAAAPGQARPVLLLAALHELVLRRPAVAAAPWFARASSPAGLSGAGPTEPADGADVWADVRSTLLDHTDEIRAVIASRSTQTNDVNRAVYVAALLARAAADVPDAPVALVEVGCSAGLLLAVDRYRVALGDVVLGDIVLGDPASPVRCAAALVDDARPSGDLVLPTIAERVGLDRAPVALDDLDEVRWLEACLWPDQPERLARFRAAVALLRPDPPRLVTGDMVDDLAATAGSVLGADDVHLVVLSSWALTYVRRDRRDAVAATLADLAADGRPVTWATAEPPGAVPGVPVAPSAPEGGETVLALRRWRAGPELPPAVIGSAHPHATWLSLP